MDQDKYHSAFASQEQKFLRIKDVMDLTALSKSSLYELSARGIFPKSVPLVPGGTSRAWLLSEVQAYMTQRIADRDQEASDE